MQHKDNCGFALYGPPAICMCRGGEAEGEKRSSAAGAGRFDEMVQTIAWAVCPLIKPMLDDESVARHPCRQCRPHETGYGVGTPMCLHAAEEVVRIAIKAHDAHLLGAWDTARDKAVAGVERAEQVLASARATSSSPSQAAVLELVEALEMIKANAMQWERWRMVEIARAALSRYRATSGQG